ncbi:hypothetical protein C0991_006337, partial [Blastosporella zonata]
GLKTLKDEVKAKKTKLKSLLMQQKYISSEDEAWLDHEGNLVDLETVVDKLETAASKRCTSTSKQNDYRGPSQP